MAKVLMFPQKKKLPKGVEDHVYGIAKEYVATLKAAAMLMEIQDKDLTQEEITEMVGDAFTDGLSKAIDELE